MKNNIIKILSVCLCAVLLVGTVGGAVFALTDNNKKSENGNTVYAARSQKKLKNRPRTKRYTFLPVLTELSER